MINIAVQTEVQVKKAPKWGDGLPSYIKARMIALDMRPSLNLLADKAGVTRITLFRNFHGERPLHFETAKRIAAVLQVSLDDLAKQSLILEDEA